MKRLEWKIEHAFNTGEQIREISVAVNGFSYLVIYGSHINGGFCAIPNREASCELSALDDFGSINYNAARIGGALKNQAVGHAIAEAINCHETAIKQMEANHEV